MAGTGVPGTFADSLSYPAAIRFDNNGAMYIVDTENCRVVKWIVGSTAGIVVAGQSSGQPGNTSTDLFSPSNLAIDQNNTLYITDTLNHRVQMWSNGASYGITVAGTGEIHIIYT